MNFCPSSEIPTDLYKLLSRLADEYEFQQSKALFTMGNHFSEMHFQARLESDAFSEWIREARLLFNETMAFLEENGFAKYESRMYWEKKFFHREWVAILPKIKTVRGLATGPSGKIQNPTEHDASGKQDTVGCLPRAQQLAYLAAEYAESENHRQMTDREAYDWLKENGIGGDEFNDYKLPLPGTFADYLTKARRALGEQRKQPRGGRTGRTVKRQSEI
jgi:hypothetical protein